MEIEDIKKIKIKYEGPGTKILIIKSHNNYTFDCDGIFEINEEDIEELIKSSNSIHKFEIIKENKSGGDL